MQVLNTLEDLIWLRDVHCKGIDISKTMSAVVYGNEDSPEKVEWYRHREPRLLDTPVVVYVQDEEGNLVASQK